MFCQLSENIKKLSISILFLALSLVFGYLEVVFPISIASVGIKIGLCNIVSIVGIKTIGVKKTIIINVLRLIILGILFSNMVRFLLSVSGFILSFLIMCISMEILHFSIITSSIFGGVFHNIGQIIMLGLIMKNFSLISLIPLYTIIGIITGSFVGVISNIIYKKIDFNKLDNK